MRIILIIFGMHCSYYFILTHYCIIPFVGQQRDISSTVA